MVIPIKTFTFLEGLEGGLIRFDRSTGTFYHGNVVGKVTTHFMETPEIKLIMSDMFGSSKERKPYVRTPEEKEFDEFVEDYKKNRQFCMRQLGHMYRSSEDGKVYWSDPYVVCHSDLATDSEAKDFEKYNRLQECAFQSRKIVNQQEE